jgi:hypothetical protein
MCLLAESFRAYFASKRFLAGVRTEMNLDVALVQEASVTDGAPVDRFLFPEQAAQIVGRLIAVR